MFPAELGFPGHVVASNITPDTESGLGGWTDGEKIRAIREGVSRDGRPLFGFMPYEAFSHMSDEDVQSVVAYMKTAGIRFETCYPGPRLEFPVSLLSRLRPAARCPGPVKCAQPLRPEGIWSLSRSPRQL